MGCCHHQTHYCGPRYQRRYCPYCGQWMGYYYPPCPPPWTPPPCPPTWWQLPAVSAGQSAAQAAKNALG